METITYTIKIKDVKEQSYTFIHSYDYTVEFDKNGKFILMAKDGNESTLLVLCDYDKIEYCYFSYKYVEDSVPEHNECSNLEKIFK